MILNPSPSSLGKTTLFPIKIQNIPNVKGIIPAAKSGLNCVVTDFDITQVE